MAYYAVVVYEIKRIVHILYNFSLLSVPGGGVTPLRSWLAGIIRYAAITIGRIMLIYIKGYRSNTVKSLLRLRVLLLRYPLYNFL